MYGRGVKRKITIAQILKEFGYRTVCLHSNAAVTAAGEYKKGFDIFRDLSLKANSKFSFTRKLFGKRRWAVNYTLFGKELPYTPADQLVRAGLKVINEEKNRLLFLWLFFMDVHHPYLPPGLSVRERIKALKLFSKARTYYVGRDRSKKLSEEEKKKIVELYDFCIRFVDEQIGILLEEIKDEDWIVVITSDHGDELFDRGWFGHGTSFYEELIHVPLIIYDGENRGRITSVVGHMDVVPTILDMIGIDRKKYPIHGINAIEERREAVIGEVAIGTNKGLVYRGDIWKLIRVDWDKKIELYNLKEDPHERNNLVRKKLDVTIEILKKLERHEDFEKRENIRLYIKSKKF